MSTLARVAIVITALSACPSLASAQQPPQVFTGRISDSMCGASHQATMASRGATSDRECVFECLKALAKFVLVDQNGKVFLIANQDLPGLPLYTGRPVRLTGELKGDAIVATRVEAIPPHLHLGHVMTNWRDTPGGVGFLIAAISDAKTAVAHAKLAEHDPTNLADMKLHAGHVLNALDPSIESKGPGSGYGVKKAVAGALQHLNFAAQAEGATDNVKTHVAHVSGLLNNATQWTDDSIALAQRVTASNTPADAAPLIGQLSALVSQILDNALTPAQVETAQTMKAEGILENMPR